MTSYVIWWLHMTFWHHTVGHDFVSCHSNQKMVSWIAQKSHFLIWWPWLLTYDLDLSTWPRYEPGWPTCTISAPYVKRFSRESAELQTHTHTQTGPILLPRRLTREVKKTFPTYSCKEIYLTVFCNNAKVLLINKAVMEFYDARVIQISEEVCLMHCINSLIWLQVSNRDLL